MYFSNIHSLEELKVSYKKLARKHHPDAGGSASIMAEINAEFDSLFKKLSEGNGIPDDAVSARYYQGFHFDVGARYNSSLSIDDITQNLVKHFSNAVDSIKLGARVGKVGWNDYIQPVIESFSGKVLKDGIDPKKYQKILKDAQPEDSDVTDLLEEILSDELLKIMHYANEYLKSFRYTDKDNKVSNFYNLPCTISDELLNQQIERVQVF